MEASQHPGLGVAVARRAILVGAAVAAVSTAVAPEARVVGTAGTTPLHTRLPVSGEEPAGDPIEAADSPADGSESPRVQSEEPIGPSIELADLPPAVQSGDEARRYDAETLGEHFGISADEHLQRDAVMTAVRPLFAALHEEHAEVIGGTWFEHAPRFAVVVSLGPSAAEAIGAEIAAHISTAVRDAGLDPAAVVVEIRSTPATLDDLLAAQQAAHGALTDHGILVSSSVNETTATVELFVEPGEVDAARTVVAGLDDELPPGTRHLVAVVPSGVG
jgi:hypothetical protein